MANRVVADLKLITNQIDPIDAFVAKLDEAKTAYDMAKELGPKGMPDKELLAEADEILFGLSGQIDQIEMRSLMSGKHDGLKPCSSRSRPATAAQRRTTGPRCSSVMQLNYLEKAGFAVEEVERGFQRGGHRLGHAARQGPDAFGFLKRESAARTWRGCRRSTRRDGSTSFASVEPTPSVELPCAGGDPRP